MNRGMTSWVCPAGGAFVPDFQGCPRRRNRCLSATPENRRIVTDVLISFLAAALRLLHGKEGCSAAAARVLSSIACKLPPYSSVKSFSQCNPIRGMVNRFYPRRSRISFHVAVQPRPQDGLSIAGGGQTPGNLAPRTSQSERQTLTTFPILGRIPMRSRPMAVAKLNIALYQLSAASPQVRSCSSSNVPPSSGQIRIKFGFLRRNPNLMRRRC